ncbi:MAG: septal ring lytic transglycosylase RlpA family protein [bacterium]
MHKYKLLIITLIVVGSIGFVSIQESLAEKKHAGNYEYLNEESVDSSEGQSFSEIKSLGNMVASWYGHKFLGKTTASGERFNPLALTAAHKSLPFGTMLKLTNPLNQKSVVVKINDRGPFKRGRELDLSRAAADTLGITSKGIAKIAVEKIQIDNQNKLNL